VATDEVGSVAVKDWLPTVTWKVDEDVLAAVADGAWVAGAAPLAPTGTAAIAIASTPTARTAAALSKRRSSTSAILSHALAGAIRSTLS
jgi:hypothetical protein